MPAIGQKGEQAQQRSCLVPRGQPRSNVPRSQSSTAHRPQWRFPFLGRTSPGLVLRRSGRLAPAYPRWLRLPAPRSKTARSLSSPFAHKGRLDTLEGLRGALASACPQPAVERPTLSRLRRRRMFARAPLADRILAYLSSCPAPCTRVRPQTHAGRQQRLPQPPPRVFSCLPCCSSTALAPSVSRSVFSLPLSAWQVGLVGTIALLARHYPFNRECYGPGSSI